MQAQASANSQEVLNIQRAAVRIRRYLLQGMSIHQIRNKLKDKGLDRLQIETAITRALPPFEFSKIKPTKPQATPTRHYHRDPFLTGEIKKPKEVFRAFQFSIS